MLRKNQEHRVRARRTLALKTRMADLAALKDNNSDWAKSTRVRVAKEIESLTKKLGHSKEAMGVAHG